MTEIVNMARTDATNYKNAGVVRVSDHLYIKFKSVYTKLQKQN